MTKVVLYIASSIDGYIAEEDGNLDWLNSLPNPDKCDHGYSDFLKGIGTTIIGRKTYEEVLGFGVNWPYVGIKSFIVTSDKEYEPSTPDTFLMEGDLREFVSNLKQNETKDIWLIGGGELISYFLDNDLIDAISLFIAPKILGSGIPLFPKKIKDSDWKLVTTQPYSTGIVNVAYEKKY